MSSRRFQFLGLGLAASLALSACMEGSNSDSPRPTAARAGQAVERDIEAPELFSKRDSALWDGRPSLGGVWVAHPDVREPQRVIIRNSENGQETVGALFRRERMNPGPAIQVSADAASAIGMLAGAPTQLEVVALRTEEIRTEPEPEAVEDAPEAAPTEVAAPAPTPAPAPEPAQVAQADSEAPQAAPEDVAIAMPEEAQPARRGLFGLFGRRAQADAAPTQADPQIEVSTLDDASDAVTPSAPPPMPAPSAQPPAPAPAQQQAAPQSQLDRPYLQLGIFSVEANANRARELARGAGLSARVVAGRAQGNDFWRVIVGPAATQAEQRQMMTRIRGLGFNDAYPVRR